MPSSDINAAGTSAGDICRDPSKMNVQCKLMKTVGSEPVLYLGTYLNKQIKKSNSWAMC